MTLAAVGATVPFAARHYRIVNRNSGKPLTIADGS
jgi:hypothetical protein